MLEMLLGVCGLAVFLVVIFVAGYFFYKFKNARLTSAWGPLVGLVNGTVRGDGGGGTSSTLSGTYQGRPVVATLAPNLNESTTDSTITGVKYNYFDVALTGVPGRQNWTVDYRYAALGLGQPSWSVQTKDNDLKSALEAAGVINLIANFGQPPQHFHQPPVEYRQASRTLLYRADVSPVVAPSPQQFEQMVTLLARLAEINAQVNAPLA